MQCPKIMLICEDMWFNSFWNGLTDALVLHQDQDHEILVMESSVYQPPYSKSQLMLTEEQIQVI